jgi:transcriptional regulator with XRE-family HTH domain
MASYEIGSFIRRLRIQKGLRQEELAYPIIDQATLSKIENGRAMPNKKTMEALFERLGVNPNNLAAFFLDKQAAEVQKLCDEIDRHLSMETPSKDDPLIAEIDKLIKKFEAYDKFMLNELHRQYLLIAKATNAVNKQEAPSAVRALLNEAIKITLPDFNEAKIETYFLSLQDFKILNLLSIVYANEKNYDKTTEIRMGLKRNLEKHCIDKAQMGRLYPVLAYNLANNYFDIDKYEEAIKICDEGIRVCLDTRSLHLLPFLVALKGMSLMRNGDKIESERLLRQAYYALEMYENPSNMEIIRTTAKDGLGIDIAGRNLT